MYGEDYQAPSLVSAAVAVGGHLAACLGCDGSPCMGACPHGIEIGKLTRRAAALA
jgi:Fe-S-cluster-containing dehydrogenase component